MIKKDIMGVKAHFGILTARVNKMRVLESPQSLKLSICMVEIIIFHSDSTKRGSLKEKTSRSFPKN
jgi:hypothetical protein